jgi:NTE family protein
VTEVIDGQVRALRKRQLIAGFVRGAKRGTYWGIRSDIPGYGLPDPIDIGPEATERARSVPTRLAALDDRVQRDLINWGYAIADTALRRWVHPDAPAPAGLPFD